MGGGPGGSSGRFSKLESGKWFPTHLKGQETTAKETQGREEAHREHGTEEGKFGFVLGGSKSFEEIKVEKHVITLV